MIENGLIKPYPDKKVNYSNKLYVLLKRMCEKFGNNVSDESIFNKLENALTYSDNWTGLKKEIQVKYKMPREGFSYRCASQMAL